METPVFACRTGFSGGTWESQRSNVRKFLYDRSKVLSRSKVLDKEEIRELKWLGRKPGGNRDVEATEFAEAAQALRRRCRGCPEQGGSVHGLLLARDLPAQPHVHRRRDCLAAARASELDRRHGALRRPARDAGRRFDNALPESSDAEMISA